MEALPIATAARPVSVGSTCHFCCRHLLVQHGFGRRRRRQLLDTRSVRQPRGGAAGARMGGWNRGLVESCERVRKCRRGARSHDQRNQRIGDRKPQCHSQSKSEYSSCRSDLCLCDPRVRRPVRFEHGGCLRQHRGTEGTLTATSGDLVVTRQGSIEVARDGFSDLYPEATLRAVGLVASSPTALLCLSYRHTCALLWGKQSLGSACVCARRSQFLRNPHIVTAPRAELRRKDSNAGAVTKLVNLVK